MTINLKRRDGVRQSTSLLITRTMTSWLGVWKPVDFERKYLLEKVNQSNNAWLRDNELDIHFIWQQLMLSENQPLFVKR